MDVLKLGFVPQLLKLSVTRYKLRITKFSSGPTCESLALWEGGGCRPNISVTTLQDFCFCCMCALVWWVVFYFYFFELALWYCNRGRVDPKIHLNSFQSCTKGLFVCRDHMFYLNVDPTSAVCHV